MRLLAGGNFGIGTTNPSFKLHVDSDVASGDVCFIHHDNASQSSGTVMKIRSDAGDNAGSALLNIENNTGNALYVRGDRNVGIGTTSPTAKLEIKGTLNVNTSGDRGLIVNPAAGSFGIGDLDGVSSDAAISGDGTHIKIVGVSEYLDNFAAINAGLSSGEIYRTGDVLKIVH